MTGALSTSGGPLAKPGKGDLVDGNAQFPTHIYVRKKLERYLLE